ncbi:hypothetical protein CAEBREN_20016 [Caenorhabditis brenneri]|uniref:RING-type domain-containing protein n=1 Tax=Caenorhabditis brenneri TaxID=135651 RepID=G0N7H9_CAEBE|nr:hypothetical protein CAEBREN_20016 [Caenorhabditis brenneri]
MPTPVDFRAPHISKTLDRIVLSLELELIHTRHILYQTEEELHITNEVLASVQYENQMRKQQIERIRGPRVDRQLPECPICFETYSLARAETKPRILHCGHTLCNQCIRGMMAAETTHRLHCSLCRFSCMVIAPEYLPLNWAPF